MEKVNRFSDPVELDKNGRLYTEEERKRVADRRGVCAYCGVHTHEKNGLTLKTKPISYGIVSNGICINCIPRKDPPHKPESSVTKNLPQSLKNIAPLDQPNAAVTTENLGRRSQHETMERDVDNLLQPLKSGEHMVYKAYKNLFDDANSTATVKLLDWAESVYNDEGGAKYKVVDPWRKTLVDFLYKVVGKWRDAVKVEAGLVFASIVKEKLGCKIPAALRMCLVLDRANALFRLQAVPGVSSRGMDFYCALHVKSQDSVYLPWTENEQERETWKDIDEWW